MLVLAQMIASGLTVSTECNVTVPCFFAVYEITIRRYEIYLRVVKTILFLRMSKISFYHKKIKVLSSNRCVMFFLMFFRKT